MSTAAELLPLPIQALNDLDETAFMACLGGIVEHSPWVARRVWACRPFTTLAALARAFADTIHSATVPQQLALLRAHPELAGREARAGTMTPASNAEQARLGLLALDPHAMERLTRLNLAYQARFGYPFIVALRLHDSLDGVLRSGEARLRHDPSTERTLALEQVIEVVNGRLARVVHEAGTMAARPTPVPTPAE